MDSSAVVSSKAAIECLILQFVSPLLPRLKMLRPPPTIEEQKKVGKQMHAVVILYNYYQRKESRLYEYLDFRSFCETACVSYPSLIVYMNVCIGKRSFEDAGDQFSITEKFVMNACNICTSLNSSIDSCNTHTWAISKVAVFLVDAAKENCLLKNGNVILGSWSLVEKDLEKPLEKSDCSSEMKYARKNKGTADDSDKGYAEDFLEEIAYSIVEKDMGIMCSNLNILEHHFSYSLNHPKSRTILYIMSYKLPASSGVEIRIEDVISLRGPPVKCSSYASKPEITSVAEHYCLLPYVGIISEWASRKRVQGDPPHPLEKKAIAPVISPNYQISVSSELTKGASDYGFLHSLSQNFDAVHESKKKKLECKINDPSEKSSQHRIGPSSSPDHNQNSCYDSSGSRSRSFISNKSSCIYESSRSNGDLCLPIDSKDQEAMEKKISYVYSRRAAQQKAATDIEVLYSVKKQSLACCDGKTLNEEHSFINQDNIVATALQNFPAHHKLNDYASRFMALAPTKNSFEAIVFEFLKKRRDDLCCQHRLLEDFIAQCEMNIQILIGGENQVSHPEEIMKSCDFLLSCEVHGSTNSLGEVKLQPYDIRKKLLDADLRLRSSCCKDLEEIFRRNHWILPKYSVYPLPDKRKFRSILTVKGLDFEYTLEGDPEDGPDQARESAAASMLTKMQEMAAKAHLR